MSISANNSDNIYLSGSIPGLFVRTAAPIILIMMVNGLHIIIDTYFLGLYVGANAVTAVSLMFPLYMMLVALTTLVSNGFSSIYARLLGGDDRAGARELMASATQLTLLVCAVLAIFFAAFGGAITHWIANGSTTLSDMGQAYMRPTVYLSVASFLLAINVDALRGEGRLRAMAGFTLSAALANIALDWLFLGVLGLGVSGSAWATSAAQGLSLCGVIYYRQKLGIRVSLFDYKKLLPGHWKSILALGAPSSLGYLGLALSSAITLFALQIWASDNFAATSGAFGINTRLMTFIYLPLLGVSIAFQTMVGNNYGAGKNTRVNAIMLTALAVAVVYCTVVQLVFQTAAPFLGGLFVDDFLIQGEVARIMPIITLTLFVFGPLLIVATYYQAIGDATRAAILQLSRTYVLTAPLTLLLPMAIGEVGIWYAPVVTEVVMLVVTLHIAYKDGLIARLFG